MDDPRNQCSNAKSPAVTDDCSTQIEEVRASHTPHPITSDHKRSLPRTDLGTVLLHWTAAIVVIVSLVTGLRISADTLDASLAATLSPLLPQGEIWTMHLVSGLALIVCAVAYALYLARSGIATRLSARRVRAGLQPGAGLKLRTAGLSVLLHWTLFGILAVQGVTGLLLYLGHGGWIVWVHASGGLAVLAYIIAHVVSHLSHGGWPHLLRIVRPARLAPTRAGQRQRRLLMAVAAGAIPLAFGIAALEAASRPTLEIGRVIEAPTLDGTMGDAAWGQARPIRIRTNYGSNLQGTGESTVEVRAVQDGSRIHFAFRWSDPTPSLQHLPLVKRPDGWYLQHNRYDIQDETSHYEDKFSVAFSRSDSFGGGGAAHIGPRPLEGRPGGLSGRGLHYTADGSIVDMWHWKASRGGLLGFMDDNHFGPPAEPTQAEVSGEARYTGGYQPDPGRAFYASNFQQEPPGGYRGPVAVRRLPRHPAVVMAEMNSNADPAETASGHRSQGWMHEAETLPYSAAMDAEIPVGTTIPSVLIQGEYAGDRADVSAAARWADGYWTLEVSRALHTGSQYDVAFEPGRTLYLWVAVFDQAQTRHTRHAKPISIVMR